jgi:hypothetical protein
MNSALQREQDAWRNLQALSREIGKMQREHVRSKAAVEKELSDVRTQAEELLKELGLRTKEHEQQLTSALNAQQHAEEAAQAARKAFTNVEDALESSLSLSRHAMESMWRLEEGSTEALKAQVSNVLSESVSSVQDKCREETKKLLVKARQEALEPYRRELWNLREEAEAIRQEYATETASIAAEAEDHHEQMKLRFQHREDKLRETFEAQLEQSQSESQQAKHDSETLREENRRLRDDVENKEQKRKKDKEWYSKEIQQLQEYDKQARERERAQRQQDEQRHADEMRKERERVEQLERQLSVDGRSTPGVTQLST